MNGNEIRDVNVQQQIYPQPGFYRWFMPFELAEELRVPIDECEYVVDQG